MALRPREPFAYDDPRGVTRVFHPDHLVADDDPAVKGREHLFETADENVARRTPAGIEEAQRQPIATAEDATAEPGKRRSRSKLLKDSGE
jgi:hypothetical protein